MFVIKVDKRKENGRLGKHFENIYVSKDETSYVDNINDAAKFETEEMASYSITENYEYVKAV